MVESDDKKDEDEDENEDEDEDDKDKTIDGEVVVKISKE